MLCSTLLTLVVFLLASLPSCRPIYFYLEPGQKRCFVEQMPKHTVFLGNYTASLYNDLTRSYQVDSTLKMQITVEAYKDVIMNQLAASSGRFFFTSTESAEHVVCLNAISNNWLGSQRIRTNLEVFIGDPGETSITSPIEAKLTGLAQTVQQLNALVVDIRRDQYTHRQRESTFRDKSEYVNSHVVWWMLVQMTVLGVTCLWQMKHLERFFRSKKLV